MEIPPFLVHRRKLRLGWGMGGWLTLSKMFLERLLCSRGALRRGRPILNRKSKLPAALESSEDGDGSCRVLPGACLCPAFPSGPGGGRPAWAIAAPRCAGGRPRGCHLPAAGGPGRRVAPLPLPGRLFTLGRSSPRAAPARSPAAVAVISRHFLSPPLGLRIPQG